MHDGVLLVCVCIRDLQEGKGAWDRRDGVERWRAGIDIVE